MENPVVVGCYLQSLWVIDLEQIIEPILTEAECVQVWIELDKHELIKFKARDRYRTESVSSLPLAR